MSVIDHKDRLWDIMSKLCMNEGNADVIFIVNNERFPAHRTILAASNDYFRALLCGGFSESVTNEIKLDVDSSAFGVILKYIYTGLIPVSTYNDDLLIKILNLANEYGFEELVSALIENLRERLKCDNVLVIAGCANLNNFTEVLEECLYTIDDYSENILEQTAFGLLSKDLLCKIISRDDFIVNELQLFNAVMAWGEERTKEDLKEVLSNVRFTLMQIHELQSIVEPLGVLQPSEIFQIIEDIKKLKCLPYRAGHLHRNKLYCHIIKNSSEYGYVWENDPNPRFINDCFFKLSCEEEINHIELLLKGDRCGYYIEVSRDQREWIRVVDYSGCSCSGTQNLYFKLQPVLFIYIFITVYKQPSMSTQLESLKINYNYWSVPKVVDDAIVASAFTVPITGGLWIDKYSLEVSFSQPYYVNCLWLKINANGNCQVTEIQTTLQDSGNPKQLIFESDHIGECYFFEAHVACKIKIMFNRKIDEDDIKNGGVFFHHENPKQLSII